MSFLVWLEATDLSTWVRESLSLSAFPTIITFHSIGMAFAVGVNAVMDLRILGVAPLMPLKPMQKFLPVFWCGFWVNAISGILLLIGYPTKALTNPDFYLKLIFITLAVANLLLLRNHVFRDPALDEQPLSRKVKILAGTSLFFWAAAIAAGRLLAYTYSYLNVSDLLNGVRY